jgi:hypothetical protein
MDIWRRRKRFNQRSTNGGDFCDHGLVGVYYLDHVDEEMAFATQLLYALLIAWVVSGRDTICFDYIWCDVRFLANVSHVILLLILIIALALSLQG